MISGQQKRKEIVGASLIIRDCFLDYLFPAEVTHIGKCTSFGLGKVVFSKIQAHSVKGDKKNYGEIK